MALPPPAPFVVLPDEQVEQFERGDIPGLLPDVARPEAKPERAMRKQDAPLEPTPLPKVDPAPVVVEPEPPERDPEEAVRQRGRTAKPAPELKAPEVTTPDDGWRPDPGKRWDGPCFHKGTEGRGANSTMPRRPRG
jgi:hypothetical protein